MPREEAFKLSFVLKVVAISIVVSLIARWAKWVPRYPQLKYAVLLQVFNTGLLTILLTFLITAGIYPSWPILLVVLFLVLWLSVRCTNAIVQSRGDSADTGSA